MMKDRVREKEEEEEEASCGPAADKQKRLVSVSRAARRGLNGSVNAPRGR